MEIFMEPIPAPIRNPSYIDTFSFEKEFELHKWRSWMSRHWTLAVHVCLAYATLIHLGQMWMKSRRPYRLQLLLTIWNIGLAVFSLVGFARSLPEVKYILQTKPDAWFKLLCSRQDANVASAYWAWVGTFSKAVELGDTIFIVLRKQPLIFLHWYHHATVMLYTWFTYEAQDPCHRLFIVMNYFVHSVMYSYYALRAMGFKVPRKISMVITSLQLVQMIIGCGINAFSFYILKSTGGVDCARIESNVIIATGMYISYLVLFAHFFYKTYMIKGKNKETGAGGGALSGGPGSSSSVTKHGHTTNGTTNKVKAN